MDMEGFLCEGGKLYGKRLLVNELNWGREFGRVETYGFYREDGSVWERGGGIVYTKVLKRC